MLRTGLVLGGALVLAGCAGPPLVDRSTATGSVRAVTPGRAEALAELVEHFQPAVLELVPGTVDRVTEIWAMDFETDESLADRPGVVGLASPRLGRIRIRHDLAEPHFSSVLVHELVHALMGPGWDPLPAVMKEGLCDLVATRLVPEAGPYIRARRMFDAAFAFHGEMAIEVLYFEPSRERRAHLRIPLGGDVGERLPPSQALRLAGPGMHLRDDVTDGETLYGYGMLLVERIVARSGLDGLAALCVLATQQGHELVPQAWILAAAGLDGSDRSWTNALREAVDVAVLEQQFDYAESQLVAWIVRELRLSFPDFSGQEFLDRALPTIGWAHDDVRLGVAEVLPLRDRILEVWNETRPVTLTPGRGWWYRTPSGVRWTSVISPTPADPWYVVNQVRARSDDTFSVGVLARPGAPPPDDAVVDAYLRLGVDQSGTYIVSSLPGGFESFKVELEGKLVADLRRNLNVVVLPDAGDWSTVVGRLPGIAHFAHLSLYDPDANLVISQARRGPPGMHDEVRMPMLVPVD